MKRWCVLASGVFVIAGIAIATATAQGNTVFSEIGKRIGVIRLMPNDVVARVNGEGITLRAIEVRKAVMVMNKQLAGSNANVTRKEAMQALLRTKVEMAEARKRGLIPTDAEVLIQYQADQEQWAKAPAVDRQRRETTIAAYIKGAGLTRSEYDQMDRDLTRTEMAIVRFRKQFKMPLPGADEVQKETSYNAFVDGLVGNAKLEVLRADLLTN
jgi:hypothetical protein